ncbi:MAG: hypothetical protein KAI17_24910 [Thiotrichaceae bacterium]|nr:hypothetical protein [Thiotrichaceae bacterium]
MPYINRNSEGKIISLHSNRQDSDSQWLETDNPELIEFMKQCDITGDPKAALTSSDYEIIRVIEDVIDLLVKKQTIMFTDLPKPVQRKLGNRKKLRQDIDSLENLINEDSDIL